MALSSLEYYYKKKTGKLAEDKEDSANTTTKRKSSLESYYEKKLIDRIGLDTFESDLTRANETLNSITGGWQSADYLASSRPELESMLDRSKAYKSYANRNATGDLTEFNASMDSLISTYENVLSEYDNIASYYGGFKSADAYTNYQKAQEEKAKEAQKSAFDEYRHLLEDEDFMSNATYDNAVGGNSALGYIGASLLDTLGVKKPDALVAATVKEQNDDGFLNKIDQALQSTFPNQSTHLRYLTDEEEQVYYGLLARDGADSANEFLEKMRPELNKRMTDTEMGRAENIAKKNGVLGVVSSLGSLGSSLIGGVMSTASDVSNYIKGEDVDANDYLHLYSNRGQAYQSAVSDKISENQGNIASFLYDTAMSIGNTAINALSLGGTGAMINMGMQAYASKAKEMQDMGASDTEIILTGALAGGIEALTEKVSLGNLLKPKGVTSIKTFIKETVKQMGIEASEEWVSEVLNQTVDVLNGFALNGTSSIKADYEDYLLRGYTEQEARNEVVREALTEQLMSAIGGAISGGVMGSFSSGAGYAENASLGSVIRGNNSVSDLRDITSGLNNDSYAKYLELIDNETISNARLGGLYGKVSEEVETNYQAERKDAVMRLIANRAIELGESKNSGIIASAIQKKVNNQRLSSEERTALKSDTAQTIMQEVMSDELKGKRSGSFKAAYDTKKRMQLVLTTPKSEETVRVQKRVAEMNIGAETIDNESGQRIEIEGMSKDTEGNTVLQTSEGERSISEVTLTSNDAMVVSLAQDMTDKQESDLFVSLYDGKQNVEDYKDSFELAWAYGKDGFGSEIVLSHLGNLTPTQANVIYSTAMMSEAGRKHSKINLIKNQYKEFKSEGHYDDSIIDYTGMDSSKVNFDSLNDNQKQNLIAAKVVAKEFGIDVKLFSSRHGEEKSNGYYDPKENAIYIDVYAEQRGGSLHNGIMTAMSHELTHWMKEKSPKLYAEMRELVMNNLSKYSGLSGTTLVAAEVNRMNDRHGNGTTEGAIDEYIARACEDMLSNSKTFKNALENMSEETRNSFVDKVKVMLSKIKEAISELLGRFDSKSAEAVALREMDGVVDRLAELWDNALQEAIEVNHAMGASRNDMSEQMAASDKEALANVGVDVDMESESAYPMFSEKTWRESEYVQDAEKAAKALAKALNVSKKKALEYINNVNGIAKAVSEDRERLDYKASGGSAIVSNAEYGASIDFSTICTKRRLYTGTIQEIQRQMKNTVLTAEDYLKIRNMMLAEKLQATCGFCYVEGSRMKMGVYLNEFIKRYVKTNPEYIPNMYDVNTPDGLEKLRVQHPEAYEAYDHFMNNQGKLSKEDKAVFGSQMKPKQYTPRSEYKGEILKMFEGKGDSVEEKNRNGGLRFQSFSDFEIVHLIDCMQIIMDMSRVGLAGQAYTKVPEFADALGNTGLKINLSIIAKGVDADGKLIFDDVEGMPHEKAFALREKYSKNVGTIIVAFNKEQLNAALADDRIDYIIPFHRSQWRKSQYSTLGLPDDTLDFTMHQNERITKPNGRLKKAESNFMPNEYWNFSKSGRWNAENYIRMCNEENKTPKFPFLLEKDANGNYVLPKTPQGDGYFKLLIDFKMYDNNGVGSPQMPVTPNFSMDEANEMLAEYQGGHSAFPISHKIVDKFVKEYKEEHPGRQYSVKEIVGESGTSYGLGVYLDSDILTNLTDDERKEMLALFVREELAGKHFTAYDSQNNAVDIQIAKKTDSYKNKNGQKKEVLKELYHKYNGNTVKQEAIVLIDEVIATSTQGTPMKSKYPHGYLDDNGKNDWDYFFVYLQDRNDDIWKARLNIANTEYGEKVLYDIDQIKMVEQATKSATSTTNNIVTDSKDMSSKKQFSDKDSEGNWLTKAQVDYFKDSKMRDENGSLMVMYHGTEKAGFTVFDNRFSDDGRSFFFTSSPIVAKGYSGSYDEYIPSSDDAQFESVDDYREFFGEYGEYELAEEDGEYVLTEDSGIYTTEVARFPDIADVYDEFLNYRGLKQTSGNYKTYLNLKNPLIVDAKNNNWDEIYKATGKNVVEYSNIQAAVMRDGKIGIEYSIGNEDFYENLTEPEFVNKFGKELLDEIKATEWDVTKDRYVVDMDTHSRVMATTRDYAKYAHENGYDGVIIENLYDTAIYASNKEKFVSSTVAVVFNSNQIKSVANTNPTDADDIRHSDKGDFETMAQKVKRLEREKEALEIRHQNYKDNVKKRAKIEQITNKAKRMNDLLKKNSKDYHVPEILKKPLEAVLSSIDFSSKTLLTKGVPTGKDIKLAESFENLRKTLDDIDRGQIAQEDIEGIYGHFDMPENFVKYVEEVRDSINATIGRMDSEPVVLNRLTKEELDAVYDILTIINKSIRQMDTALSSAKHEKISSLSRSSRAFLDSIDKMDSELALMKNLKAFFSWENVLPTYAMSRFGDGGDRVFRLLQDGWDKLAFNVDEVVKFTETVYNPKQLREWEQSTKTFTVENGGKKKDITLTDAQIMSLYCLAKREQAMGHLLGSGITIGSYDVPGEGVKKMVKKTSAKDDALLTEKEIKTITSSLTKEQIAVADKLQKFMNDVCAEWGNQVTMVRFGIKSFGEENYFPIQSDSNNIGAEAKEKGNTLFRLLNLSFTKSLTKNANNKIMVNSIFDVFANHASDMAKYNALALPVLDAYKWYSYHEKTRDDNGRITDDWSLRKHMDNAYGESAQKYVRRLLEDINGQSSGGQDIAEGWARKLMSNYKIASVAANLRVAVLQPTSYVRAGLLLDKKYLSKALYTNEATIKESVKKARETCGIALWKSMGFYDTNISRGVTKMIKHDESWMDIAKDKSMYFAEKGDEMTWGLLYRACLLEQKDKGLRGEELDKAVAERLRDVIYKTQVVDSTLTRTQTMRSKSAWSQILTSFMSEPSVSWSMLSDAVFKWAVEARNGNQKAAFKKYGKDIKNATMTYLITTAVASLISSLPDTFRDDDEEEFIEKYAENALDNAISDVTGLLPVVRDVFNAMKGYESTRMDQQVFSTFASAYRRLSDGEWTYKDIHTLAKAVSQASGLPFSNVMREAATLWNNTIGQIYPSLKWK